VRNGHQQVRDPNGRLLMEGDVRNGKRHGLWTSYHPSGAVQSRNEYRDGVLHGLTTTFRPNGALLYRGQNANGHPVGSWEFHDEVGTAVRTVEYDSTGTRLTKG
jgi:antitoxin component YwqK of YwqJK toxin-antitoxin module